MRGIRFLLAVVLAALPCALHAQVEIKLLKDRADVQINGQPFTSLYMGVEANKPFLYPLRTASGKLVTRGFPVAPEPGDPTDHPHQKGLWVGSEHLSGMDLWENDPSYHRPRMGKIVFKDFSNVKNGSTEGGFTMIADWMSPEGDPVVTETRTITFYAALSDVRLFDIDLNLKARRGVTFEDHHDSVIGIRLGPAFDEKNGGKAINAGGREGEQGTRGERSSWVDWQTTLNGEKVGVAMMDHPGNFGYPTRWHIRAMGLMVASPFAQHDYLPSAPDGSKVLKTGEELHLRYRVLIHPLSTDVENFFEEFAAK